MVKQGAWIENNAKPEIRYTKRCELMCSICMAIGYRFLGPRSIIKQRAFGLEGTHEAQSTVQEEDLDV